LDEGDIWDIDNGHKNDDDNGEDEEDKLEDNEDGNCDIWQHQQICLPIHQAIHPLPELPQTRPAPFKNIELN
jgi:hypothetical protein